MTNGSNRRTSNGRLRREIADRPNASGWQVTATIQTLAGTTSSTTHNCPWLANSAHCRFAKNCVELSKAWNGEYRRFESRTARQYFLLTLLHRRSAGVSARNTLAIPDETTLLPRIFRANSSKLPLLARLMLRWPISQCRLGTRTFAERVASAFYCGVNVWIRDPSPPFVT